ncbi:hypothetical protein F2Y37_14955 [Bacteroides caccae]|nr:hypothetical protein F2Y37_14955 [Bacteroides caccae]
MCANARHSFFYRFFFKFAANFISRRYPHSPPSGKEGWLKAGVVGGYTMLIINDLCIHLPPPPTGTPPSRRRRVADTIDYKLSGYYFPN